MENLLKATKQVVFSVDYSDFDSVVQEKYKQPAFSFVSDVECGNDSEHTFEVNGKVDEYEELELNKFKKSKAGKSFYLTPTLLNDLARQDLIEKGTYLINVCW